MIQSVSLCLILYHPIIWPSFFNAQKHSDLTTPHPTVLCHSASVFLTSAHFWPVSSSTQTPLFFSSHELNPCCVMMIWHPPPPLPPTVPLRRTKVRGHWVGLRLSSWHLEARAARKSGAWGSVSSTCRNTTFSSCWRTALSSCAPLGPTGLWLSSGSTLRGWKRFVCPMISLSLIAWKQNSWDFFFFFWALKQ